MRNATWIAVLIGGAAGAVAALARQPEPAELAEPELRPVAALPAPALTTAPAAASSLPPAAAPSAVAVAAKGLAPAPRTPIVGSRYELTGYEIACHEKKDPGACRAAAGAYEDGKVVDADLTRAKLFRKIELTFLVKHCESQLPAACSDLAYRYQRGDGVAKNERTAEVLLQRARELCAGRRSDACVALAR